MEITRRNLALGGMGLLTGATIGRSAVAQDGSFLGIGQGLEDFWLASDAYIFGYPLGDDGDDPPGPHQCCRARRNARRRWDRSSSCGNIRMPPSGTSRRRTRTRSIRLRFSTSGKSRGSSASRT